MLTIKQNQSGGVYTVVKTKRGPRARQISREGLNWLRSKFPSDQYPALEDIPFDYDLYRELREQGSIHTHADRPRRTRQQRSAYRSTYAETESHTLLDDGPVMAPRPQATPPVTVPTPALVATAKPVKPAASPAPIATARCPSCRSVMPDGAHFCSRCGRASKAIRDGFDLRHLWWVAAIVAVVLWLALRH